ncbi:NADP-dependent oxidoreductase [Vulcaniibacterium tengchongense]|uniref:Enoyl reductase n=1 Tax=Vulcaniibacterium tengchongense TaxID=1273429 RepID=A0A3N4VRS8_9GAMM|nr:NADP-dependent oxidoreductase [Vulcaniibacterium tengchongense]RPE81911.1 enoyl reductase [Vulcaniibacterium tengchongense]
MDTRNAREGHLQSVQAADTMQAVVFDDYGPPDVLRLAELPMPQAGAGEVRVRVRAAGVQPADCATRSGWFAQRGIGLEPFPRQLGNEFAGVIDQVGDGVRGFAPGDEVLGWTTARAYAEALTVPAAQIVRKPLGMSWAVAGALSASGQTAHTAVEELGIGPGDTVLVHAAAGGVGTVAVQLARLRGARVIGTASRENHDYLRSLGAEPVLYGPGLDERVRALAPKGVDAALDASGRGALDASIALGIDRDRIGTLVAFEDVQRLGVRGIRSRRSRERLEELAALHEAGRLRIHVRDIYPLAYAAIAHRDVENGHGRGKVVLMVYSTFGHAL